MRDKRLSIGFRVAVATFAVTVLVTSTYAATERVLHNFNKNGKDGIMPWAGLIFDQAGVNLYGTTAAGGDLGGKQCPGGVGCGTVFELTPTASGSWTETVLHYFQNNGTDGYTPWAGLIFDAAGNLYGTTVYGGAYGYGTVFELTPTSGGWTETILHSFDANGTDGFNPQVASLIFDQAGVNLYGTTPAGGTYRNGTVFELTPAPGGGWTETVLWSFGYGTDGAGPNGLIFDVAGNLYGATVNGGSGITCTGGCGTVFELTPTGGGNWSETVLYNFNDNGKDGFYPNSSPIFDSSGNLYGTTDIGGTHNDGTVFKLTPTSGSWTETLLRNFNGADGYEPTAAVILDAAGHFYGTTNYGGAHSGGTVFELTPKIFGGSMEKVLHSFSYEGRGGYQPLDRLIFDSFGNLYGTTVGGGTHKVGTVFEIQP